MRPRGRYCSMRSRPMKRGALLAAKVTVSLALLAYLFATSDLRALEERVRTADLLLLSAAVGCYVAMLGAGHLALAAPARGPRAAWPRCGTSPPRTSSPPSSTTSCPSNIGGDIVRVRDGSRLTGSTTSSLAVVGIDRILGLGRAVGPRPPSPSCWPDPSCAGSPGPAASIGGLGLLFLALAIVFFRPGIARRLMALSRLSTIDWVRERFEVVQDTVHAYRDPGPGRSGSPSPPASRSRPSSSGTSSRSPGRCASR